jgi:putative bacteriophage protein
MPKHSTYSFTDINATIQCPGYGSYSVQGEGVGDVNVSKNTDRTVHDVAADGSVMASKIAGNNGSVTINAQQTSSLHKFLQGLFNYCWQADTSEWTSISMTIEAPKMGKTYYCTGGSFVKEPDEPLQSQGQRVAWSILFVDIQRIQL